VRRGERLFWTIFPSALLHRLSTPAIFWTIQPRGAAVWSRQSCACLSKRTAFISSIEAAAFAVASCDLASGFAKIVPMILRHSLHQRLQMCVTLCYLHDFAHSCFFLLLVLDVANTLSFFCCDAAFAPCSTHAASTSGHCFIYFSVDNIRFSSHCSRLLLMLHADLPFTLASAAAMLAAARQ
jgi:hypothetical protein